MELSPEHKATAERANNYIKSLIARTAIAPQLDNPMLDIGMEDEVVS